MTKAPTPKENPKSKVKQNRSTEGCSKFKLQKQDKVRKKQSQHQNKRMPLIGQHQASGEASAPSRNVPRNPPISGNKAKSPVWQQANKPLQSPID